MQLRIWDVEHGACATLQSTPVGLLGGLLNRLAMIDSGHAEDWRPSTHIRHVMQRSVLDYLFITNADQDHMSDLEGLWSAGIEVKTLFRNRTPAADILRVIKQQGGPLTDDIERYLQIHRDYTGPVTDPFDASMGGITTRQYFNSYPRFTDTNNLSLAVIFQYGHFKILFPGDLEEDGWHALLEQPAFRDELPSVTILVASHHGRENGYCADLFDLCHPRAIVLSDKAIVHDTQGMTGIYRQHVMNHWPDGVYVATTSRNRHVLTTRNDGWINFDVAANGNFTITTEFAG